MKILWTVLCVLCAVPALADETAIPLDPAFRTGTLDNGLSWYVRANDEPRDRAFLNLIVRAGSLQEEEDQKGLAHFLEHMAFNGTENYARQEIIDYLESIGMEFGPEINAYTSFDETVYMLAVPTDDPEFLEQGFRILAEWSRRIALEEDEVVAERGVVLDEWRRRLGAGQRIYEQESKLFYAGSRYADRLPIGDPEVIANATPEPLRRFYEEWYRPDLMAVVAVGDFDEERILELIEENFAEEWGPDQPRALVGSELEPHAETFWSMLEDPELTRSTGQVLLKFEQDPVRDLDDYREATISRLVQGMFSARMRELVDRNEARFTSASVGSSRTTAHWIMWSLTVDAADDELAPALTQAMTEWERIRAHGFTETELERQKTTLLRIAETRYKDRDNQNSSGLARRLTPVILGDGILPGPEWTLQTWQELLPGIELAELQQFVEPIDFRREESRIVLTNTPEREGLEPPTKEELERALSVAWAATPDPWVDAATDDPLIAALPEPGEIVSEEHDEDLDLWTWTLSNGVRMYVKSTDFNEDRFSLEAFSTGGTSLGDPDGDISEMLAATIVASGGVGDFDAIALRKRLSDKLADTQAWIGGFEEGFSGSGSVEDLETAMQLLWLRAMQPRRDEVAFESLIERYATMIENRSMNPGQVYSDSLTVILYDHHPRSIPIDSDALREADLDHALEFYRTRFADLDDLVVVLVGAIDLDEVRGLARQYLATLPATDREESWQDTGMRRVEGPLHRVVEAGIDDKAQTTLILHGPGVWNRQQRYELTALAGVLEIRLREVLREDLSGTYGVSVNGGMQPWPEPRWSLSITFGCEPGRLDELVAETIRVLDEVREEGLPETYLDKVREQDLRATEENQRRNAYWTSVIAFRARYGIDQREELETRDFLLGFTQEDLRAAARRHLDTSRLIRIDRVPVPTP